MVEAGGRLFYIMDEGPIEAVMLPSNFNVVARDAFSGTVLWRRQIRFWHNQLYPFKSGPAQLARRLVTDGLRVYVTLGLDDPVTALDAIDGHTVRTYEETRATEEVAESNGVLFCLRRDPPTFRPQFIPLYRDCTKGKPRVADEWEWDPNEKRDIVAVEAATGTVLWTAAAKSVVPMSLTVDDDGVYYHDGSVITRLDRTTGAEVWTSGAISRKSQIATNFGPTLVAYGDYLLFAGGDGKEWGIRKSDGATLWSATHLKGGHYSPQDLMVINDLVWSGKIANKSDNGKYEGRYLADGSLGDSFLPDYTSAEFPSGWKPWYMHHRCHRAKATERYIMASRTGIEYIDPVAHKWSVNHWARSGCLYGLIPANGMTYTSPTNCACYLQSKVFGFRALAPASPTRPVPGVVPDAGRLEEGPAYGAVISGSPGPGDWPTFRHDALRSGCTATPVGTALRPRWRKRVGGKLSALTGADGKIFVSSIDRHRLFALDADTGKPVWSYTAGGRIDSPPTIYEGRVLFGCADGYAYCLRATDGELIWRYRVAPLDLRLGAWEQVESVWPLSGSLLVQDDGTHGPVVYALAGRMMFLDGGLRLLRLDPATGTKFSETIMDDKVPGSSNNLQTLMSGNRMPVALPDILSSDGTYVYMRAQRFDLNGDRAGLSRYGASDTGDGSHLFNSVGFLDGTWFHRSYFIWGKDFNEGWGGWPDAGEANLAAGRILLVDNTSVYGYCRRRPEGFDQRAATPFEYCLFGTIRPATGYIEVANTTSLNPAGVPVSVEAWVKPTDTDGVVVARGGTTHGYSLYLKGGVPCFAVRVSSTMHEVEATSAIPTGTWTHLVGVLGADGKIRVYVNGAPAATPVDAGFLASDPTETMQVGYDTGSNGIGDYATPFGFNGTIDQVRVYIDRALSDAEVLQHFNNPGAISDTDTNQRLCFSFDAGTAVDESGNGNDGVLMGAKVTTAGKIAKAFNFANATGTSEYLWARDIPVHARAMTKAADAIFVAGPPDIDDQEHAFDHFADRRVQARLRRQSLCWAGKLGGGLHVVSPADGATLAECRLSVPPVWDGMIAVNGRIYIAMLDGTVVCYEPK